MMKTLILGVGNPILSDDGVGIHVVRKLQKEVNDVDFDEASVSGLELVEMFKGYERVIIVDAIKTKDGVPGRIYKLTPDDIPTLHGITPHDVDFKTAIELMAKDLELTQMGYRLITHVYPASQITEAFQVARSAECVKAIVEHEGAA